jgi:hypothetical protein
MVQVQALAYGLEIVCETHTGGEDLRRWVVGHDVISLVATDDPSLRQALAATLQRRSAPDTPARPARAESRASLVARRRRTLLARIADELGPAQLRSASSGPQAS